MSSSITNTTKNIVFCLMHYSSVIWLLCFARYRFLTNAAIDLYRQCGSEENQEWKRQKWNKRSNRTTPIQPFPNTFGTLVYCFP